MDGSIELAKGQEQRNAASELPGEILHLHGSKIDLPAIAGPCGFLECVFALSVCANQTDSVLGADRPICETGLFFDSFNRFSQVSF